MPSAIQAGVGRGRRINAGLLQNADSSSSRRSASTASHSSVPIDLAVEALGARRLEVPTDAILSVSFGVALKES